MRRSPTMVLLTISTWPTEFSWIGWTICGVDEADCCIFPWESSCCLRYLSKRIGLYSQPKQVISSIQKCDINGEIVRRTHFWRDMKWCRVRESHLRGMTYSRSQGSGIEQTLPLALRLSCEPDQLENCCIMPLPCGVCNWVLYLRRVGWRLPNSPAAI